MNMYLLLRDNKQTGPFTAAEIISKGIKPYDLVWVEGKSAAWRYPSELDELKAHAPATEEQPYDRFYKKEDANPAPETSKPAGNRPAHTKIPIPASQPGSNKVYVNVPGNIKRRNIAVSAQSISLNPWTPETPSQPVVAAASNTENRLTDAVSPSIHTRQNTRRDKKFFIIAGIAGVLLVSLIVILFLNSRTQKANIQQLNDMVSRMEKRQDEQNRTAREFLVSHPIHAPESEEASAPTIPDESVQQRVRVPKQTVQQPAPAQDIIPVPENNASGIMPARQPTVTAASPAEVKEKSANITSSPDLSSQVIVKPNNYRTGFLGGISNLQLVLINNSDQALSSVHVEVKYFSRDNKLVNTQTVSAEKISAGGQTVISVPKSSRGVTVTCTVTSAKS